jgi:hypothetical protein
MGHRPWVTEYGPINKGFSGEVCTYEPMSALALALFTIWFESII